MLTYGGINALSSPFRQSKILKELGQIDAKVKGLSAEYVHLVDADPLTSEADQRLTKLLSYGTPYQAGRQGCLYLVMPRPGTISPWSSKATDIIHNAGLNQVKRVERGTAYYIDGALKDNPAIAEIIHDRMTEAVFFNLAEAEVLFRSTAPKPLKIIDLTSDGQAALERANINYGLALSEAEISYLYQTFKDLGRNPTDVELMMFGQVNSEHTRHKVFNASWRIDGQNQPKSLFQMIKNTYRQNSGDILSAYSDNAAVLKGPTARRFYADPFNKQYGYTLEPIDSVIKVETHNHPTAIAPVPGAATGIGGEIRDEAATGRGAKTKMGLAGYSVSDLHIPGASRPWEKNQVKPDRIASALDIMLEAPIGGAGFANEYGRPNLAGYFRSYELINEGHYWGYHKPIMIAGGLGNIRRRHVKKQPLEVGTKIIVLGGPAMLIGLGGGAASSLQTGKSAAELDYASVQRGNGEIERRTQEVIDNCWALGSKNPILSIHDVGAGGLSNALPELVHDAGRGAVFELRAIPSAEPGLSPLEIWCNEAQERFVLAISPAELANFEAICRRERCPFAVIGAVTLEEQLVLNDQLFNNRPIDLPLKVLFADPPKMKRQFKRQKVGVKPLNLKGVDLKEAAERVLKLPSVGSKQFLITIGDRSVGGLVSRDQMVGPWQVPVSDLAVTATSYEACWGEAMAMGERTPLAIVNGPAAARMAVAEAVTNILAADIANLSDIKLSANWMAAVGDPAQDQSLFDSVRAVGEQFCPSLGLTIPVGKDSLSMRTVWQDKKQTKSVTSPVSLIVTSFSPVKDVGRTLTPLLKLDQPSYLLLVELTNNQRLGGSALAQVYNQLGSDVPDVKPAALSEFFNKITALKKRRKILAYHDRSDGGLLACLAEMAFASRCGLEIDLTDLKGTGLEKLFNEELGAVIQVDSKDKDNVVKLLGTKAKVIGQPIKEQMISFSNQGKTVFKASRAELQSWWSDTSYQLQRLRDSPSSADQEQAQIKDNKDPGLASHLSFKLQKPRLLTKPKVAIFREQGVNGQIEMAAAFDRAGFSSYDVHLNDIVSGSQQLNDFVGLVACGGFSYGDVLGAGEGWAKTILFNDTLRQTFSDFFNNPQTFSLGVCNGCQVFAALKELIPGAEDWPTFLRNKSEQFEARLISVKINPTPSILFKGMSGSLMPIVTAHGEGLASFDSVKKIDKVIKDRLVVAQFVDNYGHITENYPANPNGSPRGITALTTPDGRSTIIMPHPERVFMTRLLSWHPDDWPEDSPWMQLFYNAREWVG